MHASAGSVTQARGRGVAPRWLTAVVSAFLAAALGLTWWRLQRGADLVDEAYFVLVPWRWTLGDRPFVDEQNLSQAAGLLAYPFVRLFALVQGQDVAGLVLFDRYLYLALALAAAACAFLLARRSLPAAAAALVAAPLVTVVLFETPQLTANTMCALLLTAGAALGAIAVLGGHRGHALAAGVAYCLACVAYPTVLLVAPFVAVLLAFSTGQRAILMLTRGPAPRTAALEPTGVEAWRVLSAWVLGGAMVVLPVGVLVLALAGSSNLRRDWKYTLSLAHQLDQLGGASKAVEVAGACVGLLADQWYIVLAAVLSLLAFRARPGVGRWLLLLTPPALWLTATTSGLHAAGAVILYALAAPYLYLFVPAGRRTDGARLLACVWAPAVLVGVMIAYTSADGFVRSAVGLLPGVVVSGLFLAWGLAPPRQGRWPAWPAVLGLGAVVLVTLALQFQFQHGGAAWRSLSEEMTSGPWRGIAVTVHQRAALEELARDLAAAARPGDALLVYPEGAGYYLYWPGEIAANTYQLYAGDAGAPLPRATVSYYRRRQVVPTLVAHVGDTLGRSSADLRRECGGLAYPPVVVAPWYVLHRKPPVETVPEVLARLPRP